MMGMSVTLTVWKSPNTSSEMGLGYYNCFFPGIWRDGKYIEKNNTIIHTIP